MRLAIAILGCVMFPTYGAAQVILPRQDAVVSVGWGGSEHRPSDYDIWRGALSLGVSGGHYWTDHLKTDVEASWLNYSDSDIYQDLIISGVRTYAHTSMRVSDIRLSLGQSYQFGRNAWVHPFVGAGADIVTRSTVMDRPRQLGYPIVNARAPMVDIPAHRDEQTTFLVQPFVKTGLKMYTSERTFVATELKLGFSPDFEHAVWKLGFGLDF